jgi:hypothetical protein
MRSVRVTILFFPVFYLFILPFAKGQSTDSSRKLTLAYVDSLVNNDSLIRDLSAFIDSSEKPRSLLAVELGFGNGFFTSKNATAATGYSEKTFLTPTMSYLHKSGFGLSASAYMTQDLGSFTVYQGVITPSYQISRRNWSAGITYSRYINKDSTSFAINPMRNDIYAYGTWKKYWLEPGVAFDFSFESYKVEQNVSPQNTGSGPFYNPGAPDGISVQETDNINAHTLAAIVSIQHDFEWFSLLTRNDHIAFTPTIFVLGNSANYDVAVIKSLKTGFAKRFTNGDFQKNTAGNAFALQSAGALLDAVYSYKHFLIDPQILGNYFINASPGVSPLRISYLVNIGLVF